MSYDAVYLSPHLDDAALSCGGQIARRTRGGERVLIFTPFTADEPAPPHSQVIRSLHALFDLEESVSAHRRAEDRVACARLGVEHRHGDLAEAIYRRAGGHYLYPSLPAIFGDPVDEDRKTLERLATLLETLPAEATLYAPLGVGRHVDHLIVRRAAESTQRHIVYYEELPYAAKWGAVRRALRPRGGWTPRIEAFSQADLDKKISACSAYESQIEGIYRTPGRLERKLRGRARRLGGERAWLRR